MDRRRFLRYAAVAPVLTYVGCRRPRRVGSDAGLSAATRPSCAVDPRIHGPGRSLDAAQWVALEAACARILPTDEDVGATEANVINFIDAQLQTPVAAPFLPLFQHAARFLDGRARKAGVRSFAELPVETQDRLLRRLQRQRLGGVSGVRFMQVLVSLTLEGFFGDPIYGGNRDGVGWKMIDFTPQQPGPRCPYGGRV